MFFFLFLVSQQVSVLFVMDMPSIVPAVSVDLLLERSGVSCSGSDGDGDGVSNGESVGVGGGVGGSVGGGVCGCEGMLQEVTSRIEKVIKDHPKGTVKCDGSAESAWHNAALSAAKQSALNALVPQRSRERYEKYFGVFSGWCEENGIEMEKLSVVDVLAWLETMSSCYKISSLWSMLSGVKCMLMYYYHINTDSWKNPVSRYMREKQKVEQQGVKQAGVFDGVDLEMIFELDDDVWLNEKVALAVGLYGGLRQCEYASLTHDNMEYKRGLCLFVYVCLCVFVCVFFAFFFVCFL